MSPPRLSKSHPLTRLGAADGLCCQLAVPTCAGFWHNITKASCPQGIRSEICHKAERKEKNKTQSTLPERGVGRRRGNEGLGAGKTLISEVKGGLRLGKGSAGCWGSAGVCQVVCPLVQGGRKKWGRRCAGLCKRVYGCVNARSSHPVPFPPNYKDHASVCHSRRADKTSTERTSPTL